MFGCADLFGGERASAGAAAPVIGRGGRGSRPGLVLRAPRLNQLATALGTLSLSHGLGRE